MGTRFAVRLTRAAIVVAVLACSIGESQAAFIRVGVLPDFGNNAVAEIFSSGDLTGTATTLDVASFNALSVADLRASYDVLYIPWLSGAAANLDWTTRVLPYLQAGGGVVFEDPDSVGQLAPAVIGAVAENGAGNLVITANVPGLTDGIDPSTFANTHIAFSSWIAGFFPFMVDTSNGNTVGLYSTAFGGHIVLTGPDQNFHSIRGSNQYQFEIQEIQFASAGAPLTVTPAPPSLILAVVGFGMVGLVGLGGMRRRLSALRFR